MSIMLRRSQVFTVFTGVSNFAASCSRLLFDRDFAAFAHDVDGPVPGDGRHPRDRRRQAGLELSGAAPDLDVGLLNDLLCEILSPQDTEHHAEKFRARRGIE